METLPLWFSVENSILREAAKPKGIQVKLDDIKVEKPLNKYEAVIIMHPDATTEDQKALFTKNKSIISEFSGEINHIDSWGARKLGNPIKKLKMGIYFHMTFVAASPCILELERTMHINGKVLRYMHFRLDDKLEIGKHLENYREVIANSKVKDQEREAKMQARRNKFQQSRS